MTQKSDVIIVGNGLSRLGIDFQSVKRSLNCDLFACNAGYLDLPYDRLFAIDQKMVEELRVKNIAFTEVPEEMHWEPKEYNPIPPRNNTGMVAMQWAINEGFTNLHCYGFDFLLKDDKSKTSNVFSGHPLYGPETACSLPDSIARALYLGWMMRQNPHVNFNFIFPE